MADNEMSAIFREVLAVRPTGASEAAGAVVECPTADASERVFGSAVLPARSGGQCF